jgi:hypothetical protein
MRHFFTNPKLITPMLVLQLIPLILFPMRTFSGKSQEWWLPILLALMVVVALVQILVRHSQAAWPWYLISFAQGFNIISRVMMLMPHTTINVSGSQVVSMDYIFLTLISIAWSAFILWYIDLPEVRMTVARA